MRAWLCGLFISVFPVLAQDVTPRAEAVFESAVRVSLEIADTEQRRQRGLMYRKSLSPTEGMIFVFDQPGFYPFWMKNTLIPLDLFWLAADGTIVSIQPDLPPCGNTSEFDDGCPTWPPAAGTRALYVIETVAGFAARHRVATGQRVELSGLRPAVPR